MTLTSIEDQKNCGRFDFQVVVSDGGSTDETNHVLRRHSGAVDVSRTGPDAGVYHGMNIGADLATGTWLHFLNSGDTFYDDHSLSVLIAGLVDATNADSRWVICRAVHLGISPNFSVPIRSVPHRWLPHAYGVQPHCHQATFFRSDAFSIIGPHNLDRGFVADHDIVLRFGLLWTPFVIDKLLIKYLGGGISQTRRKEIANLLHRNRIHSLRLSAAATRVDGFATVFVSRFLAARIWIGSHRAKALRKIKRHP
jgi:putative colanic acid biosynthesis glycosyltransferase